MREIEPAQMTVRIRNTWPALHPEGASCLVVGSMILLLTKLGRPGVKA